MPWGDGTGPLGRGPRSGRGGGLCRGTSRPGALSQVTGSLIAGLVAWGGRALGRRLTATPALPQSEPRVSLESLPSRVAIGAGAPETELLELTRCARALERELEAVRTRIRALESGST